MSDFKGQLFLALALNLSLKVFTFSLTTYLTRLLLPDQSGLSFTYVVYMDAVLFIAREAVRNAASRKRLRRVEADGGKQQQQQQSYPADAETGFTSTAAGNSANPFSGEAVCCLVHLSSLALPIALLAMVLMELLSAAGLSLFPSLYRNAVQSSSGTDESETGHRLSTCRTLSPLCLLPYLPELTVWWTIVLMTTVEPCVVLAQSLDLFRVVVLGEFASLSARLLLTITLVKGTGIHSNWEARMIFAFGQLAFGMVHVLFYLVLCSGSRVSRLLGGSVELDQARDAAIEDATAKATAAGQSAPWGPFPLSLWSPTATRAVAKEEAGLLGPFFRESLLRLVLSEGESFALTTFGSETARGYYQTVSNLGSLVARLVFRVWENACFVKWSREMATGHRAEAVSLLLLMLRVSFYFGFAFTLLGPPLASLFLTTLYSSRWSTPAAVRALQAYCYALPCMAWNGLLEAFLRAVAPPHTLQRLQRWMLIESVVYVVLCYMVVVASVPDGREDEGDAVSRLILVNIVNMIWRSACAVYLALHTVTEAAEKAPATSVLCTADLLPLIQPRLTLPVLAVYVVSRLLPPSVPMLAAVGAVYVAVVLQGDVEVRRMVLRAGQPVLRRLRRGHPTAPLTAATDEKKSR